MSGLATSRRGLSARDVGPVIGMRGMRRGLGMILVHGHPGRLRAGSRIPTPLPTPTGGALDEAPETMTAFLEAWRASR